MRVFIAGIDGYLGWALAQHLAARGHTIGGLDRFYRRQWVAEMQSMSALPIAEWPERQAAFQEHFGAPLFFVDGDMLDYPLLSGAIRDFAPDAVVHLAEVPSAPYSMIDQAHSAFTQQNNVIGSLNLLWALHESAPKAHLVKLGTMGEYGTPNVDIPEGFFDVEYRGRRDHLPFPRQAGSFYHWSKVHDSNNTMFACKVWGLSATDVMQGVVYGTRISAMPRSDARMMTRLDFDTCFGTVVNRFVCQAVVGHPLTIYGTGGQTRGFIPLRDSMTCITLALENPASQGEYRVFNQFDQTYSVLELAKAVCAAAEENGIGAAIDHYENPRQEQANHYYNPDRDRLVALGYQPEGQLTAELAEMFADVRPFRSRIEEYSHVLVPSVRWDTQHRRSRVIHERPVS